MEKGKASNIRIKINNEKVREHGEVVFLLWHTVVVIAGIFNFVTTRVWSICIDKIRNMYIGILVFTYLLVIPYIVMFLYLMFMILSNRVKTPSNIKDLIYLYVYLILAGFQSVKEGLFAHIGTMGLIYVASLTISLTMQVYKKRWGILIIIFATIPLLINAIASIYDFYIKSSHNIIRIITILISIALYILPLNKKLKQLLNSN